MSLADIATGLRKFAELVKPGPTRDELVKERDALLAAPPPAPASTFEPAPLTCRCETCAHAAREEQSVRLKFMAWEGRVMAVTAGLFRLTFGDERDDPGQALAELQAELLEAIETNRARVWARVIEKDGRGRPSSGYETGPALAEINARLVSLSRHARDVMPFFGTEELRAAIDEARVRMRAALDTPLKRPIEVKDIAAATKRLGPMTQPERRPESEAERLGLRPGPGPSILEGNVRFAR